MTKRKDPPDGCWNCCALVNRNPELPPAYCIVQGRLMTPDQWCKWHMTRAELSAYDRGQKEDR